MSRIVDLLLVALVAGLGWWLFFARGQAARAAEEAAEAATLARAQAVAAAEESSKPVEANATMSDTLRWLVDDLDLARHPALTFVAQRDGDAEIRALEAAIVPPIDGNGDVEVVCSDVGPGPLAVGVSVPVPRPEVLRWWHEAAPGGHRRIAEPLPLAEILQLVRFDVVDADGASVENVAVRWAGATDGAPWEDAAQRLTPDAEGRYLLPRRTGVDLELRAENGARATISDPEDGARVQLVD